MIHQVGRPGLADALQSGPVVLDGGLATLLETRGGDLRSALWSARLLVDDPAALVAAHQAFFTAGAQVGITASYQASFEGFAAVGVDRDAAATALRRATECALRARDSFSDGANRWVAASIGPYGAVLADGSEYRGDYRLTAAELARWHRPRFDVLAESGADLLAIETLPCLAEVQALVDLLAGSGLQAWLSLTADRGRTRAGEPIEEAFALAGSIPEVIAVGVNCCPPPQVRDVVATAAAVSGRPVVAYPNSGEQWDATSRRWSGEPTFRADDVRGWRDAGAALIGGCCRVGPAQISRIAAALR